MSCNGNIIHLLPENVVCQIAAGEVVQRPASVVKELMENSVDAGATRIDVILKDSGRTLIQINDNGSGMSAEDAITAFERHATSKISESDDLYALSTMGFRGEALYSIAAVSETEVKTRRDGDETGNRVLMSGGKLQEQEYIACDKGTQMSVRHLFFNVPARRKFLKSNETELRNIISCFEQISIVRNDMAFSLSNNGSTVYKLEPESRLQRIASLFGKKLSKQMLPLQADTPIVGISGFAGSPEAAQKRGATQYFFVNGRYIQHPYFAKAVAMAYDRLIPAEYRPSFFIFLEVAPSHIDVNIHPTKTEVKFEDEKAIFPILTACVKEALNKANIVPGIDFEGADSSIIPVLGSMNPAATEPKISFNKDYNPFNFGNYGRDYGNKGPAKGWEELYNSRNADEPTATPYGQSLPSKAFLLHDKYLVQAESGKIKISDLHRAEFQILYERFMSDMEHHTSTSCSMLFPELLELSPKEDIRFGQIRRIIENVGFKFEDFGKHAYQIVAIPPSAENINLQETLSDMINGEDAESDTEVLHRKLAERLAARAARSAKEHTVGTAIELLGRLATCKSPAVTCLGKPIFFTIDSEEIDKRLNK